ncbi:MAG: GNAT family N-acetyltransferase [Xanthomonadales bacterium]|nr:GNAT family N-acetyltransferase [Xanthomonadales bacterium]
MTSDPGLLRLDCGVAVLRPWRRDDLASVRLHAHPAADATGPALAYPYPYSGGDGRAWLERAVAARGRAWAIDSDGQAIGGVSLEPDRADAGASCELGYWIGRRFHGRGLMGAVLAAFVPAALRTPGMSRLTALVYPGNPASCRVLEKTGFRREWSRRTAIVDCDGRSVVASLYAIGTSGEHAA